MFSRHISPTIGASFFTCKINLGDTTVKLQVWDTAGQERFRSMAPMYYRNANAALLVYDISNAASFREIESWVRELHSNVSEPMVISVVGNKVDLASERQVDSQHASRYAASINAHFVESSALHDQGIDVIFLNTAKALLKLSNTSILHSLRTYNSDSSDLPSGVHTEEESPERIRPTWSIDNIAHGEAMRSYMCC